jgi:hypothetical protein
MDQTNVTSDRSHYDCNDVKMDQTIEALQIPEENEKNGKNYEIEQKNLKTDEQGPKLVLKKTMPEQKMRTRSQRNSNLKKRPTIVEKKIP